MILLALSPWVVLVGGGITMCVLYEPGERIDAVGYCILAIMSVPVVVTIVLAIVSSWWESYLDFDCIGCGRRFYSRDLLKLRRTGRCPGCGQAISSENLEDLE